MDFLFFLLLYDFGAHRISLILLSSTLANRWHFGIFISLKLFIFFAFL